MSGAELCLWVPDQSTSSSAGTVVIRKPEAVQRERLALLRQTPAKKIAAKRSDQLRKEESKLLVFRVTCGLTQGALTRKHEFGHGEAWIPGQAPRRSCLLATRLPRTRRRRTLRRRSAVSGAPRREAQPLGYTTLPQPKKSFALSPIPIVEAENTSRFLRRALFCGRILLGSLRAKAFWASEGPVESRETSSSRACGSACSRGAGL